MTGSSYFNGRSTASFAVLVMVLLSVFSLLPAWSADGGTRLSELVKLDVLNTYTDSEGVDGWGEFVVGRVNTTTIITTRVENKGDVPLKDVEVTCTVYWYDGFYPDRGAVMFMDTTLVDVPPGDGEFSRYIRFYWVPSFAGAYMINISAHVPGDAREMSTEPLFFQGLKYEPIPGQYFYTGVWVATEYWNGSSMEGWETNSTGAPPSEGWGSVIHPESLTHPSSHSVPYCFWAGNRSSWNASLTGSHALISPPLNLERFDPEPYDVERSIRRPQILLLYRYRGNLSSSGPEGGGSLDHYVSVDDGETWEPLLDPKERHVSISGNTTGSGWSHASRPFYVGNGRMVGLDLAAYQGETIRLMFVERVSGLNETGYLLDDITVMGMDLVVEEPFYLTPVTKGNPQVDPGSNLRLDLNLSTRRTMEELIVRLQCINGSGSISPEEDVRMIPEVLKFEGNRSETVPVEVRVDIPSNERSGPGHIEIRAIGGGISRDLEFRFEVRPRHDLKTSVTGITSGVLAPDEPMELDLELTNSGNVQERIEHTFVSGSDLEWTGGRGRPYLEPGESLTIQGEVRVPEATLAESKLGFLVASLTSLPSDAELLDGILSGEEEPSWKVHEVNFSVEQYHSIELMTLNDYREVEGPPDNGTVLLNYGLLLLNNGNGRDLVTFAVEGLEGIREMEPKVPDLVGVDPGGSEMIDLVLEVSFPVPMGRYTFNVTGRSMEKNSIVSNSPELVLVIGSNPVSRGTYLINGSLSMQPGNVIMGMETIISFRSQSFGIPESDTFTVGLLVDDLEVTTDEFVHSLGEDNEHQMTWSFDGAGPHNVSLVVYDDPGPDLEDLGLLRKISRTMDVHFIDLNVSGMKVGGYAIDEEDSSVDPGTQPVEATIWNLGDIDASIVTVNLEVMEMGTENASLHSINITDIQAGKDNIVQFKAVEFMPGRSYRLIVSVDNKGRWSDSDENNELSLIVNVDELPPEEPVWRDRTLFMVVLGVVLVLTLLLFFYLMRKKL